MKKFEESKNATIYTFLFMQRLCAISSLSGLQRAGLPKGKNESVGRALLAMEAAHTDHHSHESRKECCTGDS